MSVSLIDGHIDNDVYEKKDNKGLNIEVLLEKLESAYKDYYDKNRGMPYDLDATLRDAMCCISNLSIELQAMRGAANSFKEMAELLEIEKQALIEAKEKATATAMGVIKRQDAEIERLRENNKAIMQTIADVCEVVVKEFAERLKKESRVVFPILEVVAVSDIDNLVKEMVGAESG